MELKTLRDVCLDLAKKYREQDKLVSSGTYENIKYCEGICVSVSEATYQHIDRRLLRQAIHTLPSYAGSSYKWTRGGDEAFISRAEFLEKFAEIL